MAPPSDPSVEKFFSPKAISSNLAAPDAAGFQATRWTLILSAARGKSTSQATDALAELCRIYWYPLYAYIRRRGHNQHEAEDLTQEFFSRLLGRNFLDGVSPEKGKFRSFLLVSFKNFLINQQNYDRAEKRGGNQPIFSLDALKAESRFIAEPVDSLTPERLFERHWALAVLDQVLNRLQTEFAEEGKSALFDTLKNYLTGAREVKNYADCAAALGTTEGAVKTAVHRLRKRYRAILRDEIAQTVETPEEIEDEIRYLLSCL